jgi:hypothetical protein
MALMRKCIVIETYSFQEAVEEPTWVDAMVEEYDSIVKNSAWEICGFLGPIKLVNWVSL